MTLTEYLKIRLTQNGRPTSVPALSSKEAKIIGIPLPLCRGWAVRHGSQEVPESLVEAVRRGETFCRKTKEEKREPKNNKKRRKKESKKANRQAHVGYSQPWIAPASNEFLQTYEWRRVRLIVLKRDGAKCACCGATPSSGAVMNVDHIKPRKLFPHLALDPSNLQVLCHECNHGKGNWDMTDFREQDGDVVLMALDRLKA